MIRQLESSASNSTTATVGEAMLVSQTPQQHAHNRHHRDERTMPRRKKRRTILESLQTMSLKTTPLTATAALATSSNGDSSEDDGNSSCATGGSLLHDDGHRFCDGTTSSMGSSNAEDDEEVLLSDQEKVHRDIMYQLATGKTPSSTGDPQRQDVVRDRIEHMIRQSRLRAAATATDDFDVAVRSPSSNDLMMMDVEPPFLTTMRIKRSNSLPRNFEAPPLETIEVEIDVEV